MGELDGPEYYPEPVGGRPNDPRLGRRGNRGLSGTGLQGNIVEDDNAYAWGVVSDNGFEVWNNGELVASGGDRLTRGAGRRGRDDFAFGFGDEEYYSDGFDDFGTGTYGRGPPLGSRGGPFGRGSRRGPGELPPGMEFNHIPPWFLDEFDDDGFDDFQMIGALGGRPPRSRGSGPRRGGRGGIRVTRQGGGVVVDNEFEGTPRESGGRTGYGPQLDNEYENDDDDDGDDSGYDDELVEGSLGGRNRDRIMRFSDGATLRIHQG
ncbi:hypothetical protein AYL99_07913 [Fonsecaea erecta]|uniref:Uncharacterized protein n=1 Tax=Fonsecaea erecta TaxID=1367422 RepID=A0A178ZDM6_9EURO|nr:hypothetical protein AYL99_07913 [Fonsecaea erecta]OAP57175.1 hypothetical protein AYL99_07913 [Fonsecaea erecta]